jgi:hypothetical protein
MSRDPVTNSMLGIETQKAPEFTVDNNPEPPNINVFNLDQYTKDALRNVLLDLRIKRSRIKNEREKVAVIIAQFKKELEHLLSRDDFYQDIMHCIESYFQEETPCPTNEPITQPEKNSKP